MYSLGKIINKIMKFQSSLKGKILNSQTREVIANVIHFMRKEAVTNQPLKDFKKVQERVVLATGVSLSSVQKIAREMKLIEDGECASFVTPNKKIKISAAKTNLDDFDIGRLRRYIKIFYITEKQVPTLRRIHKKFTEEYNYTGSRESLRKIMKKIGFRWRKTRTNRKLLMEKPEIQHLRLNFLRQMKRYRNENRPIIYTDETYIHSCHTNQKGWADSSNEGLHKPVSKGQMLIIVNAGAEHGFVKNAYLRYKPTIKSGDYHDAMNYENYKKWLQDMLIPNLPPNSVLVIDNASYHNVQCEKVPTMASRKAEMQEWLTTRNIGFTDDMYKADLYHLIKLNKPQFKTYEIDKILADKGHSALRLPPYHPDFNPIELVWASMKQ